MKRDLRSLLSELQRSGEVKTGRQFANTLKINRNINLFPDKGREEETSFGCCYLRELKYAIDHCHGNSLLSGALCCRGPELALPARDNGFDNFNLRKSLFLDIETTGLSGGTGTWAFLIGIGWFEKNHFLLRQYFLRRPSEERALLDHFTKTAANFSSLITFNGKMFDLPLIQTRQMLAGFKQTDPCLHLDLLQCARVLWKKRLPSRSLRAIEESLLGLQRYDDIPGSEIPAVYFDYLRRGKSAQIKKVFDHNVLDILSMVTLLERIARLAAGEQVEHPAEALALGRLCLKAGRIDEGIDYLRAASSGNMKPLADEAAMELSFYFKRQRRWQEAAAIWREAADNKSVNPVFYIELAKYYEHRCRKYQSALELTDKALVLVNFCHNISVNNELSVPALQNRKLRLQQRLAALS